MSELLGVAEIMLSASQRRLETVSHNVSNSEVAGHKRLVSFENILDASRASTTQPNLEPQTRAVLSQGGLSLTGRNLDLALTGEGFFQLSDGETQILTRNGAFSIAADGRLQDVRGFSVLSEEGGEIYLSSDDVSIETDGVILENGIPLARIGVVMPDDVDALEPLGAASFAATGTMRAIAI